MSITWAWPFEIHNRGYRAASWQESVEDNPWLVCCIDAATWSDEQNIKYCSLWTFVHKHWVLEQVHIALYVFDRYLLVLVKTIEPSRS